MKLGIYCAGKLGRQAYDVALRVNTVQNRWDKIFFIDDIRKENVYYDTDVYRFADVKKASDIEVVIANGTPVHRQALAKKIKQAGMVLTNLIDPSAVFSNRTKIYGGGGTRLTVLGNIESGYC